MYDSGSYVYRGAFSSVLTMRQSLQCFIFTYAQLYDDPTIFVYRLLPVSLSVGVIPNVLKMQYSRCNAHLLSSLTESPTMFQQT